MPMTEAQAKFTHLPADTRVNVELFTASGKTSYSHGRVSEYPQDFAWDKPADGAGRIAAFAIYETGEAL